MKTFRRKNIFFNLEKEKDFKKQDINQKIDDKFDYVKSKNAGLPNEKVYHKLGDVANSDLV